MNKAVELMNSSAQNILSVYFTAGYPRLESIPHILTGVQQAGADMVEIGIPFSDPMADGPVIQMSSQQALRNGFTLKHLFSVLRDIKREISIPVYLMSYYNPIFRYGMKRFLHDCAENGVSGTIIPDMPVEEYLREYRDQYHQYQLSPMFLFSPSTDENRLRLISSATDGFLYMVSGFAITGAEIGSITIPRAFAALDQELNLSRRTLVGFGIKDSKTFRQACTIARGAIVGSAFIRHLEHYGDSVKSITRFIHTLREEL